MSHYHYPKQSHTPLLLLLIFSILIFIFYPRISLSLDRIAIPLTFSHHILEYHFFFKRGMGLCNPFTQQGKNILTKEKVFFICSLILNIGILTYYYNDIELSEKLYNALAFFHCFVAGFFFIDYFKQKSILKISILVIALVPISLFLCYLLFFYTDSELSENILSYGLDLHLLIWFLIFYFDFKESKIDYSSIILILSFWILYFSEVGWFLDYAWVFFSFNHIAFESYVLVIKKR